MTSNLRKFVVHNVVTICFYSGRSDWNSVDAHKCHPNARVAVIIMQCIEDIVESEDFMGRWQELENWLPIPQNNCRDLRQIGPLGRHFSFPPSHNSYNTSQTCFGCPRWPRATIGPYDRLRYWSKIGQRF